MKKDTKMSWWNWFKLIFIGRWIFFKLSEREREEILEKVKKTDNEDIHTLCLVAIATIVILALGIVLYAMFK